MRTNAYLPQIIERVVGFYADGPNADPNAALFVRARSDGALEFLLTGERRNEPLGYRILELDARRFFEDEFETAFGDAGLTEAGREAVARIAATLCNDLLFEEIMEDADVAEDEGEDAEAEWLRNLAGELFRF